MILVSASILVSILAFPSTSFVSAQSSHSNSYSLSSDITTFVPACAQQCFRSFIETGFPASLCSTSPSLNCLCSHSSVLGYTLGEGALQCILAENSVNACQGTNSSTPVILGALNMCVGTSGAVANTHSIITATLEVPRTAPTLVLNVATGGDGSGPTAITSASTASSTASVIRISSAASVSPGTTDSTNAPALAVSQTPQSSVAPTGLTTPQTTGIVVGSAVLAIMIISGLILFICVRRRGKLRRDNDSDFGTFQDDHGNSMEQMFRIQAEKKNLPTGRAATFTGVGAKSRPVVPPRVVTDPNMFSRRSVPIEQIGIALSPDLGYTPDTSTPEREFNPKHSSKLLPEKPSLPKPIPTASPLPALPPESTMHPHWRPQGLKLDSALETRSNHRPESEVTAFEEDLPANLSSPPDLPTHPIDELDYYTGRDWRSDPQGGWQNGLIPRASTAPMEAAIRPLEVRKAHSHQSFSQPIRPLTTASSIYSPAVPSDPVPDMPCSGSQRLQHSKIAESYQPYGSNPYGYDSASVTSIESSGDPEPRTFVVPPPELSPVVESPVMESPVGRSPVSYPKIPGRLSDEQRYWAPAKEPNFEPWRQAEIAMAKSRELESTGFNKSMNDAESPRKKARQAKSPKPAQPHPSTESSKAQLDARRGKKLAPALSFQNDRSTRQDAWRIVVGNYENDSQKLTPTKVGNDLYLNVQNI